MTLSADERAAIVARDAATELMGDPIAPPEGVVWSDSCVMRAYDRRVLLAALVDCERLRWHHSPDAPVEHFCDACDEQRAALVAAEAGVAKLGDGLVQWMEAAKAEEARAKALADRLQSHVDQHWSHGGGFAAKDCGICIPDLAALAAYREPTP